MDDRATSWVEGNTFRIREMFDLFDKDKSETVVNEEVKISGYTAYYFFESSTCLTKVMDLGWGHNEGPRGVPHGKSTHKRYSP